MMNHFLKADVVRFGLVSVLGLAVDIATAWGLAAFTGLSLALAAVIGFAAGALFNYFLHEFWTFREGIPRISARRSTFYIAVIMLTLGTRLAVIAVLDRGLLGNSLHELPTLLIATGFSFSVHYVLSKYLVFKRLTDDTTSGITQ